MGKSFVGCNPIREGLSDRLDVEPLRGAGLSARHSQRQNQRQMQAADMPGHLRQ